MDVNHKLPTVDHIEPFISAEIPDKKEDPELYSLLSKYMIHGPCGSAKPNCPCMVDGKCSKNFPKKFAPHTCIDSNGFPVYKRADSGNYVEKSGVKLDNRSVVPYNKTLLKRYQAHINVEWCNQAGSIKFLFKYINKGPDRASVAFEKAGKQDEQDLARDEIKEYYDCRYISGCEASWRIFAYEVHYRYPAVIRLPFHLTGQHNVVYGADDDIDDDLNKQSVSSSKFLAWMSRNQNDDKARKLSYVEFPTKYVWKLKDRCWEPRKIGRSIGRIHSVSPALGEAYFLRILLNKVKGPKCFEDIRTANGQTLPTFKDACYALGLLDDDMEYIEAIKEASITGCGYYLRALFGTMLLSNTLSRPDFVWEKTWEFLSDGILHARQKKEHMPGLSLTEDQIKNLTLGEIEKYLLHNNSTLKRFTCMPYPSDDSIASANNRLINEELSYDRTNLGNEFQPLFNSLTDEQRCVFDEIIKALNGNKGGVFFVYGYGGTGKTFLWKTLSVALRSKGEIVLNVASSGIASLLLSGGRTAHSRFHIPINLNEDSICHIKPNSPVAHLLKETKLIIWDEAPMIHKHAFEALDRTLKDISNCDTSKNSETPFGGKVIVFGGDFRQILPVVPNGSKQQIVNASLSSSYLWSKCKVLRLTKNTSLTIGANTTDMQETINFAKWLLDIGEGKVGGNNDGITTIDIPADLLINPSDDSWRNNSSDPVQNLIDFVYPSILQNFKNPEFFRERAILAPKNEVVQEINDRLLSLFPGEEQEYLSSDSICPSEQFNDPAQERIYSPDVLNGLKISGLPNHRLVLKVGVPVMLLRNIDQQNGLCKGTRLQILTLGKHVIEAEIISGGTIGTRTYIPRINMILSDKKIPFKFQRRQFPLCVCFAMTINKSQGQSLSRVGLYLKQPVFTHGQLYVALSRVNSRAGAKLLILDKEGNVTNQTTNVV
ncbi:putative DNA helicase [Helianthus debilis subsp. tardiflorus]